MREKEEGRDVLGTWMFFEAGEWFTVGVVDDRNLLGSQYGERISLNGHHRICL